MIHIFPTSLLRHRIFITSSALRGAEVHVGHLLAAIQIRQHKTLVHQSQEEMIPCCLVCCPRYHPPHRTDQTHLQPLSNHVDCYKAAGMKADVASKKSKRHGGTLTAQWGLALTSGQEKGMQCG